MLTVPKSKVVRGFSFFGVSFVYIIFEDGTDIYWARSRVLEYLNAAARKLPTGVTPTLGPGRHRRRLGLSVRLQSNNMSLADLRSLQDWNFVTESPKQKASPRSPASAASSAIQCGGPIPIGCARLYPAFESAGRDPGQQHGRRRAHRRTFEFEFIVRGRGYLKSIADLSSVVLRSKTARRCCLKDVRAWSSGPTSGAASPNSRRGRSRQRHCAATLRPERA